MTGAEPGVTSTVVHAWATGHTITSAHSTNAAVQYRGIGAMATRMARRRISVAGVRGRVQQWKREGDKSRRHHRQAGAGRRGSPR